MRIMIRNKKNLVLFILLCFNMLAISIMMVLISKNICLNYDEFFSINWTGLSWTEMMTVLKGDVHPPLYYIGLKFARTLFGDSIYVARTFSMIPSFFLILLTIVIQREIGWKGAFWYLNFLVGNAFWFQKASEIRMYSWLTFWCVLNFIY